MRQSTFQEHILQLTHADSRETLLSILVSTLPELNRVTLWWQDDDVKIPLLGVGRGQQGVPFPLPLAPQYLLSVTPPTDIPASVLSVLGLNSRTSTCISS